MSKPQITKSATCLCGSIAYTITGVDRGTVLCHCSNCQKASGSAFLHNLRITDSKLMIHKGEELVRCYEDGATKTGNVLARYFCGRCGSPLWLTNPKVAPDLIVLHLGTAQERTQPFRELFTENKHEWLGDTTTTAAAGKAKL